VTNRTSTGLDGILDCSRAMETCARDGRWEELLELETARAGMIDACFGAPVGPTSPQAAECLAAIMESNRIVLQLSEGHRDHLMGLLRGSRLQCQAANAYQDRAADIDAP